MPVVRLVTDCTSFTHIHYSRSIEVRREATVIALYFLTLVGRKGACRTGFVISGDLLQLGTPRLRAGRPLADGAGAS